MRSLMSIDPFEEMRALQQQLFGQEADGFGTSLLTAPVTDVYYTEGGQQMMVELHLANFREEDIDIQIDSSALVVSARRESQQKDKDKKYVVMESRSSFYRRIQLPNHADIDKIEADLHEGILKITIPIKDKPTPKKVSVKKGRSK